MKYLIATRTGGKSSTSFIQGLDKLGLPWIGADPTAWQDHMWCYNVDIAVIFGCRKDDVAFRDCAERNGVKTVIVDLGYVNRFNEAHRVNWDGEKTLCVSIGPSPGCLPSFPCPSDRREALGVHYPRLQCNPAGYVLVIGQWPVDLTHPFRSNEAMENWAREISARIPNETIVFRPHPRAIDYELPFIETALAGAKCVVTWGSNVGNDALLAGVPVVSVAGPYAGIVERLENIESFVSDWWFPDEISWNDYFNRLAYGQWSFLEFEQGLPQKFLEDHLR